jgi:hypothetical protein
MIKLADHQVVIRLALVGDHFVNQKAVTCGQAGCVASVQRMLVVVVARQTYYSSAERNAKVASARTGPLPDGLPRKLAAPPGFVQLLKKMHELWLGHRFLLLN